MAFCTEPEIQGLISSLAYVKSPDEDLIPPELLKLLPDWWAHVIQPHQVFPARVETDYCSSIVQKGR